MTHNTEHGNQALPRRKKRMQIHRRRVKRRTHNPARRHNHPQREKGRGRKKSKRWPHNRQSRQYQTTYLLWTRSIRELSREL